MKYLCLVVFDGRLLDALGPAEKSAFDRECLAYDRTLMAAGQFVHAEALQSPTTARTVAVREGRVLVTDGPFIEAKEHVGGFILIDADSMDQAVQIAAGIPLARLGRIEVRPIYHIPGA